MDAARDPACIPRGAVGSLELAVVVTPTTLTLPPFTGTAVPEGGNASYTTLLSSGAPRVFTLVGPGAAAGTYMTTTPGLGTICLLARGAPFAVTLHAVMGSDGHTSGAVCPASHGVSCEGSPAGNDTDLRVTFAAFRDSLIGSHPGARVPECVCVCVCVCACVRVCVWAFGRVFLAVHASAACASTHNSLVPSAQ